jgi:UDP-N-acetylmuramoylalanine--D-glutamate ligase
VALGAGVPDEAVGEALRTFAGVPHRLEEIGVVEGVTYVNDSKATNVASTLVALASFDAPIRLILGGQGKDEDYTPLRAPVAERCAGVYLIGEEAERLAAVVGGERCGTLERALDAAAGAARPGEVVLLSPACASFDQFDDYEARGLAFKELVAARRT